MREGVRHLSQGEGSQGGRCLSGVPINEAHTIALGTVDQHGFDARCAALREWRMLHRVVRVELRKVDMSIVDTIKN
jgi:hypothetical protein